MNRKILIAAAAMLLVSAVAWAAVAHVSWTNATQNTDGSAIPASGPGSLVSTTTEWSSCGPGDTFTTKAGELTVPKSQTAADTPDLAVGRWCLRAYHTNTYGVNSDPSGTGVKVVAAPKPNPPGNFSVD